MDMLSSIGTSSVEEDFFSYSKLYPFPKDLKNIDAKGKRKKIAIVGGGISGLVSAYELESLGHHVKLFESDSRLGGRILTVRFENGRHGELGAMRVNSRHNCVMHYIKKFSIPIRPSVSCNYLAYFFIKGIRTRMNNMRPLWDKFNLKPYECHHPVEYYSTVMDKILDSLSNREKRSIFETVLCSKKLSELDQETVGEFWRKMVSPELFELIGHATGMRYYDRVSLLGGIVDYINWDQGSHIELINGMDTLVTELISRLKFSKVLTQTNVISLEIKNNSVKLYYDTSHKNIDSECFDFALVTVPGDSLKKIDFQPSLPEDKINALSELSYSPSVKTLAHCKSRFWEIKDNIAGGSSFTDLPIQRLIYPGDNAIHSGDNVWKTIDSNLSHSPAVFTACYLWENRAIAFSNIPEGKRDEFILNNLNKIHPGIIDVVDSLTYKIWNESSGSSSSAYAVSLPGQRDKIYEPLRRPIPQKKPSVYFAGEHLDVSHGSIEGSIQTAMNAVVNIISIPCSTTSKRGFSYD